MQILQIILESITLRIELGSVILGLGICIGTLCTIYDGYHKYWFIEGHSHTGKLSKLVFTGT